MTKPNYGTPDLGFIPNTHGATSFWNHFLRAQSHNYIIFVDTWICFRDPYLDHLISMKLTTIDYGFPSQKKVGFPSRRQVSGLIFPTNWPHSILPICTVSSPVGLRAFSSTSYNFSMSWAFVSLRRDCWKSVKNQSFCASKIHHPPSLSFCASKINMKKQSIQYIDLSRYADSGHHLYFQMVKFEACKSAKIIQPHGYG